LKGMILTILGQGLGSTLKMLLDMCPARTFKLSFCNTFLLQVKSYLFACFACLASIDCPAGVACQCSACVAQSGDATVPLTLKVTGSVT
jgi:hypothetical protein